MAVKKKTEKKRHEHKNKLMSGKPTRYEHKNKLTADEQKT
jgi:hypothetical protein